MRIEQVVHSRRSKKTIQLASMLTAGVGLSGVALAQEDDQYTQADSDAALEEVIVTATGRPVSLLDAPAAVTAFTAQQIEDAGIKDVNDYVGLTPGVTVIDSHASAFGFILIRGIYQVRNTDSSVAYVLDDVVNTSPFGFKAQLYDVEQIEILKGPQGALYGRNAVGGAILINTKDPTNEFESFVRGRAGNGDTYGTEMAISGPIVDDTLLFRVSAFYEDSRGFIDNVTLNEPSDPSEKYGINAKLIYKPSDTFQADLRVAYDDYKAASELWVTFSPLWNEANGILPPEVLVSGADPSFVLPPDHPLAALVGDPNGPIPDRQGNIRGHDFFEQQAISLKMEWSLPDYTIRSVSAYDYVTIDNGGEQFPYSRSPVEMNNQRRRSEAYSTDLRAISEGDGAFRWMVGTYLATTSSLLSSHVQHDDGTGLYADVVSRTPILSGPNQTIFLNVDEGTYDSYAAFGQFQFDLSDNLELTLAFRYDYEDRESEVLTPLEVTLPFSTLLKGDKRDKTFSSFQPKVTLRYEVNDDLTLYTNYSEAFRSGGFNPNGINAEIAARRANGELLPPDVFDEFDQEDTRGIDMGFKSYLLDGKLSFNAAAYYTEVENQFLFEFLALVGNSQNIRNIDKSEIKGYEVDATWHATENLQLIVGHAYTSATVEEWKLDPGNIGNDLPFISETDTNVGIQYRHSFGEVFGRELVGMFRADWNRIGETPFNVGNFAPRDPVELVNLRASFDLGEDITIAVFGNNVTDEKYYTEIVNPVGLAWQSQPDKWGVEFTKRF